MIKLSTKYDFQGIRADVLEHLSRVYPTTIEEYEAIDDNHLMRSDHTTRNPSLVLKAAIEAGVDDLFPALYYACIRFAPNPRESFPNTTAGWDVLDRILVGRDMFSYASRFIISIFMEASEKCVVNHLLKNNPYENIAWNRHNITPFSAYRLRRLSGETFSTSMPGRMCDSCRDSIIESIDNERKRVWNQIPGYFNLGDWDVVRTKLKAAMQTDA